MERGGESSGKLISSHRFFYPNPRSCIYTMHVVDTGLIHKKILLSLRISPTKSMDFQVYRSLSPDILRTPFLN